MWTPVFMCILNFIKRVHLYIVRYLAAYKESFYMRCYKEL